MRTVEPGIEDQGVSEISMSEAELRRLEPNIDSGLIHRLVQQTYDELMPAKVHSYVPILVSRSASCSTSIPGRRLDRCTLMSS